MPELSGIRQNHARIYCEHVIRELWLIRPLARSPPYVVSLRYDRNGWKRCERPVMFEVSSLLFGESSKVRGRISQGANKPGGETAKGRKSQIPNLVICRNYCKNWKWLRTKWQTINLQAYTKHGWNTLLHLHSGPFTWTLGKWRGRRAPSPESGDGIPLLHPWWHES